LEARDEGIVVSKFEPKSLLDLNFLISHKDEKNYDYEIKHEICGYGI